MPLHASALSARSCVAEIRSEMSCDWEPLLPLLENVHFVHPPHHPLPPSTLKQMQLRSYKLLSMGKRNYAPTTGTPTECPSRRNLTGRRRGPRFSSAALAAAASASAPADRVQLFGPLSTSRRRPADSVRPSRPLLLTDPGCGLYVGHALEARRARLVGGAARWWMWAETSMAHCCASPSLGGRGVNGSPKSLFVSASRFGRALDAYRTVKRALSQVPVRGGSRASATRCQEAQPATCPRRPRGDLSRIRSESSCLRRCCAHADESYRRQDAGGLCAEYQLMARSPHTSIWLVITLALVERMNPRGSLAQTTRNNGPCFGWRINKTRAGQKFAGCESYDGRRRSGWRLLTLPSPTPWHAAPEVTCLDHRTNASQSNQLTINDLHW